MNLATNQHILILTLCKDTETGSKHILNTCAEVKTEIKWLIFISIQTSVNTNDRINSETSYDRENIVEINCRGEPEMIVETTAVNHKTTSPVACIEVEVETNSETSEVTGVKTDSGKVALDAGSCISIVGSAESKQGSCEEYKKFLHFDSY